MSQRQWLLAPRWMTLIANTSRRRARNTRFLVAAGSDDSLFLELLKGCGYVISEMFRQSGLLANKITGYIGIYSTRTGKICDSTIWPHSGHGIFVCKLQ